MNKSLLLASLIAAAALTACGKTEEAPVAMPAAVASEVAVAASEVAVAASGVAAAASEVAAAASEAASK